MSRRPWFLIQTGGGWENRPIYTWRGFCQENKAISLAATAAGFLARVLLEHSTSLFPLQHAVCTRWLARQGQLSTTAAAGSVARQGILGQYYQNFICLWRRCTSTLPGFLVFHRSWQDTQSTQLLFGSQCFPSRGSRLEQAIMGPWENPSTLFDVLTSTLPMAGDLWNLQDQPYFVHIHFSKTIFGNTIDDSHKHESYFVLLIIPCLAEFQRVFQRWFKISTIHERWSKIGSFQM